MNKYFNILLLFLAMSVQAVAERLTIQSKGISLVIDAEKGP